MKKVRLGNHTLEIYDSIEELPMIRFHKYNKMLLVDAGIGSDLSDVDRHIEKAIRYSRSKTPELAAVELDNMRQNIYFIQSNLNPKHLAFAALIKSIDGKPCHDLSEEGLRKVVQSLEHATIKEVMTEFDSVKKKIDEELQMYFPQTFDDAELKEYFDKLKRRTMLMLDSIINGETDKNKSDIEKLTDELMIYSKPYIFSGTDNMEINYDKQFERMCLNISQNLNVNPKNFTVLEYYNSYEYIKELIKERKKSIKAK